MTRAGRLFVTGGTGVLGRGLRPLAAAAGHDVEAPGHDELDLFDPAAVTAAVVEAGAILHLATRIPPWPRQQETGAWVENDRLRSEAARILVDAALAAAVHAYVQPSVTFLYGDIEGPLDESTHLGEVPPSLRSALAAELETARFAAAGRRGVVLRLGLLDGPGTGIESPDDSLGATLHVADAADALLRALGAPSGVYNVCRDGPVSSERFRQATGWRPTR